MKAPNTLSLLTLYDRFIPPRNLLRMDIGYYCRDTDRPRDSEIDILTQDVHEYMKEEYRRSLQEAFHFPSDSSRLLWPAGGSSQKESAKQWPVKRRRKPVITTPECALDLPEFKTLHSLDLLDWGTSGYMAAALNRSVFLCHPDMNKTIHLANINDQHAENGTAVKWDTVGKKLAVGTNKSNVQVWDTTTKKKVGSAWCSCIYFGECSIQSMAWSICNTLLVSGCSGGMLCLMEVETGRGDERGLRRRAAFRAHEGLVLTLRCSPSGRFVASVGVDCAVRVWTWPRLAPHVEITSDFPVRALAWHPWKQSLLAVGGGLTSGYISLYNVNSCRKIASSAPRTRSSVLCLAWSALTGELVVSYWVMPGRDVENEVGHSEVLVLTNLNRVVDKFMSGYLTQVGYLMWSPDGRKLATASSDETLRIWNFLGTAANSEFRKRITHSKVFASDNEFNNSGLSNYVIR